MKPLLVFPLAGLGVRFTEQGITTPKQLLKVDADISCLEKTILSIKNINDFNIISNKYTYVLLGKKGTSERLEVLVSVVVIATECKLNLGIMPTE